VGGASLYVWLYLLCGVLVVALVALGGVLWVLGRRAERGGRSRAVALADGQKGERPRPGDGEEPL
jgi:hypothetical protein